MRRFNLTIAAAAIVSGVFSSVSIAQPPSPQDADPQTRNVHELGHELRVASFAAPEGQRAASHNTVSAWRTASS